MSEKYLSREEAAAYVSARGLATSKNTLQKYATLGGGPIYRRFGNKAVYLPSDLDDWIGDKLSTPRASTSEVLGRPAT